MATADFGLHGKLAVVTGSSAGIGRAIAKALASHGMQVVVNGRSDNSCATAIETIAAGDAALAARLHPVVGDVSTATGATDFIAAVGAIEAKLSLPVEVLVNNVGIFEVKDFFEIDDAKWQEYWDVNTMSGVRLTRHWLKPMLARNSGRVIFVSSEAGLRPLEHMVPYSVSKTTQISLARGLAELTKGTKVTVNSVLPGPTMTEGVQKYMQGFAKEKGIASMEEAVKLYFAEFERTSLLQRFLEPSEVANVVAFIASAQASSINGAAQHAEGGIIRHI